MEQHVTESGVLISLTDNQIVFDRKGFTFQLPILELSKLSIEPIQGNPFEAHQIVYGSKVTGLLTVAVSIDELPEVKKLLGFK